MRKKVKKLISFLLILVVTLCSVPMLQIGIENNSVAYAAETEKVKAPPRYHLDLIAHHTWGYEGGKWDYGAPETNYKTEPSPTFPKPVVVKSIKIYDGSNFKWGEKNYTHNTTGFLKTDATKGDYEYNYGAYEATKINASVNSKTPVDENNPSNKVSYSLSYDLDSGQNIFNLKYLITQTPDYVWNMLGGRNSVDGHTKEMLEKAASGKLEESLQGRLYFVPVVIEYYYPDEGASPFTEEEIGEITPGAILEGNNMKMLKIDFLDENEKPTTVADIKNKYYIRYALQYLGEDMTEDYNMTIHNCQTKDAKNGTVDYKTPNWEFTRKIRMNNKEGIYFTSGPFSISKNSIYTCGTIAPDIKYNRNTTDDFGEAQIGGIVKENLSLKIEKVNPTSTKIYSPSTTSKNSYEVQCKVNYETDSDSPVETILRIEVPNNSNTMPSSYKKDILAIVEPGTNIFTFSTSVLDVRNHTGSFNINMEINPTRKYPQNETTFDDNKDTIKQSISTVKQNAINPCAGYNTHTLNKWNVTYHITTKTGASRNSDGKCRGGSLRRWEKNSSRTESFNITSIKFKSKDSGTVELLKTNGKIKAGYGFELDITAKLQGTESPSRPSEWSSGCNYQRVSPRKYQLGTLPDSIYVV